MTTKNSISKDLDEFCHFLDIDQATLRRLVQVGVERLLKEPQVDPRINAYLHSDPENKKEIST